MTNYHVSATIVADDDVAAVARLSTWGLDPTVGEGAHSITATQYVDVPPELAPPAPTPPTPPPDPVAAAFTCTPAAPTRGNPVSFDATSSAGPVDNYAWDYGDGATDTGPTTTHTFASKGTFTVTLTVFDAADDVDETQKIVAVS